MPLLRIALYMSKDNMREDDFLGTVWGQCFSFELEALLIVERAV